jgi:hypothetical protein
MTEPTWDVTMPAAPETRQRLADCAKRYDWPGVFAVLDAAPELINSTRPEGRSWYAPLHQAALAGAPADVVERLVERGAWRGLRTAAGERPVDIARRGKHAHLVDMLEPPRLTEVPAETLRRIQVYFHAVIQARVPDAGRLPELEVLLELAEPRMWFHDRFVFWLEPDGPDTRLVVDAFGERHHVTADEVRALVRVPADGAEFRELLRFAHSYNGYDLHGGSAGLSAAVIPVLREWQRTGELAGDLDVLRACLFFQQRSHYWEGGSWDFGTEPFVVALMERIRALSGGAVPRASVKRAPA